MGSDETLNPAFTDFFKDPTVQSEEVEKSNKPIAPNEKRVVGKIIKISSGGWGFISSLEIKFTRIFFHWTALRQDTLRFQDLKNGMKVEFTPLETDGKSWRAIKIRVIKDEPKSEKPT